MSLGSACDLDLREMAYTIYLDGRKLDFQPLGFLEACWTDGFDTACSICRQVFDNAKAPVVRTIRVDGAVPDNPPLVKTLPPLVMSNTHLECLKQSGQKYIPISHAWHGPVTEAYASRKPNLEAATLVLELPLRTLLAATKRFGPETQIWHDYISIPQWQDSFRGTVVLPQIFEIFRHGELLITHLYDEPAIQLLENYTPAMFVSESENLENVFSARWFRRMWIAIEYDMCQDCYILNRKYEFMPGTLSMLMRRISDCHISFLASKLSSPSPPDPSAIAWIKTVPNFVKERVDAKCLGYVYDIIGDQGCRSYRDRFVAACALLRFENYSQVLLDMPRNEQEACLWVSKKCLQTNDFSVLLLRPSNEQQYKRASWLKGHTALTSNMWNLSIETRPANICPRVKDNEILLHLELMGTITGSISWRPPHIDNYFGFAHILSYLIEPAAGSTSAFLRNLERIYPSEFFWVQEGGAHTFPGARYRMPTSNQFEKTLDDYLKKYSSADKRADATECSLLCERIVSLLALTEPPSLAMAPYHTLGRLQLYALLCVPSEYILLTVQCPTCKIVTLLRATLWAHLSPNSQMYRIPGLAYKNSIPEGMGMIVDSGQVVGRTRFGLTACRCNPDVLVKL